PTERSIEPQALDAFAPTLRWTDPLLPTPLTSREGARGFLLFGWEAFPDLRFEPVGRPLVDEVARTVAQEWIMTGSDSGVGYRPGEAPSGRSFEVAGMDVWGVDEHGRAVSVAAYWDAGHLSRQLSPS
uniref:nuclear transport factor 2 family protein n=1 Tax=Gordonia desulfuricans TaxID=89051 RepID=UPI00073EB5F3